jgi:hypothetical protein
MRCVCCNERLSDFEATRKSSYSGEYLDMCNVCFNTIKDVVDVEERSDLRHESDEAGEDDE